MVRASLIYGVKLRVFINLDHKLFIKSVINYVHKSRSKTIHKFVNKLVHKSGSKTIHKSANKLVHKTGSKTDHNFGS
jgi:hypothetical protein